MFFDKEYSKADKGKIRIYLNENEYDLSQPIRIVLNGNEIFNGMVEPTLDTMVESCALFYDPERLFPAAVDVDIAAKSAVPTSIHNVKVNGAEHNGSPVYDLTGRRVEEVSRPGIYIKDGKAMMVK